MKEAMKAAKIPDEIFKENSQNSQWNIQWKHPALIMKEAMKVAKIPNAIFNESAQHNYEIFHENTQH